MELSRILLSSARRKRFVFDEDLMLQGRNFATKIWNAFRLIQGWKKKINQLMNPISNDRMVWGIR